MSNENKAGVDLDSAALNNLEALALAWQYENCDHWYNDFELANGITFEPAVEFIAAANPAAVLALIDRARRASATPSTGGVAAALPGDWTAEWDTYSAPGTIRLHSPKWGGAFLGEPKSGDIALPAIVYRLLAEIISSASQISKDAAGLTDDECDAAAARALAEIAISLSLSPTEVNTNTKAHWSWGRALVRAGFALAAPVHAKDD